MNAKYQAWLNCPGMNDELLGQLKGMTDEQISDSFYRELAFGTGGLRGVLGAGTNRMNLYTVSKATRGLGKYLLETFEQPSCAVSCDSRIHSTDFARLTAATLAEMGVRVYIYRTLMPTPMLSYAVRHLHTSAGVMVTASHNPAKFNGYKVYGADGCQITIEAADRIYGYICAEETLVPQLPDFDAQMARGMISWIDDETIESYYRVMDGLRIAPATERLHLVYSPLNGTGNVPVREMMKRMGNIDVEIVAEQELPDGNFPTAPYPNPEIRQAFECALKLADELKPELLLATDPDCDRVGIAVRDGEEYKLLSGNDVGALLLDFVLARRKENGTLPENPLAVKTIVTTELCRKIAEGYGCELVDVLTGFKFIGEQITMLEAKGEENRFVFGFEESYGYLGGTYVRDKDAVIASMLICEMVAYYKAQGKNLIEVLEGLYKKYGYYICAQKSFTCEGESGMKQIKGMMEALRTDTPSGINGSKVVKFDDYEASVSRDLKNGNETKITLPRSNVLCFYMEDGCSLIVRPSGTEPKIKLYIGAVGKTYSEAEANLGGLTDSGTKLLGF